MRLLLVEDHQSLSKMIAEHLELVGFVVDPVGSAEEAITALDVTNYDGVVLDLSLPGADGMTVLQRIRSNPAISAAVVILTARDALESRLTGLNSGADDYIVKPFDLLELEARLRAVLRRPGRRQTDELAYGDMSFNVAAWDARANNQQLDLARKEFVLLEELMRAAPRVVVKDQLEDKLYGLHEAVTSNAIEAIVSRLRKKFSATGSRMKIVTVRGIGYKMVYDAEDGMD